MHLLQQQLLPMKQIKNQVMVPPTNSQAPRFTLELGLFYPQADLLSLQAVRLGPGITTSLLLIITLECIKDQRSV